MRRLLFFVLLFAMSGFIGCNEGNEEVKKLEDEVMAIHDEVMPKITDLFSAKKELEIALKNGADSITVFSLLKELDGADESMQMWMEEYEMPDESLDKALKMSYLNEEKSKITKVKESILASIDKTTQFTGKYIKIEQDSL